MPAIWSPLAYGDFRGVGGARLSFTPAASRKLVLEGDDRGFLALHVEIRLARRRRRGGAGGNGFVLDPLPGRRHDPAGFHRHVIKKFNLRGTRVLDSWDLTDPARHIDWTPFFSAWALVGRFPAILEDEVVGEAARKGWDAKSAERWLSPILNYEEGR